MPKTPPAGWHPDPHGRHELRYHNGRVWTEHVSDGGVTSIDQLRDVVAAKQATFPAWAKMVTAAVVLLTIVGIADDNRKKPTASATTTVVEKTPAPPARTPPEHHHRRPRTHRCAHGIQASKVTGCGFATSVLSAYAHTNSALLGKSRTIRAYSPGTGQHYRMHCVAGYATVCKGGAGAVVRFSTHAVNSEIIRIAVRKHAASAPPSVVPPAPSETDGDPYPGENCTEIGHSFSVRPGSDPEHDRDGDGLACEAQG